MKETKETPELHVRPRPAQTISLEIPQDTLDSLKKVAATRDMSSEALAKFYIGQGLRQDLARLFADRVLDTTEQVLARHLQSAEEVSAILREIRTETTGQPMA